MGGNSKRKSIGLGIPRASGQKVVVDECSSIDITAQLVNVQPGLRDVKEGYILTVSSQPNNQVSVVNHHDEICGYVRSSIAQKLIPCLTKGVEYEAAVRTLAGDSCTVNIRLKE